MYGVYLLFSGFTVDAIFTCGSSTVCYSPSEHTHGRYICILVMVWGPHQECTEWLLPPILWVGGSLMLLSQQSSSYPSNMVRHTALEDLPESHLIPPHSLYCWEGSFPGLVPPNDIVDSESDVGMKHANSGPVIWYQVDEFTHTWLTGHCVAWSHIYPGFMGKMSSLTHFPLEPGCEDYSNLD